MNFGVIGRLLALANWNTPYIPSRNATKRHRITRDYWLPNGERERARRLRQIEAGQLGRSNGVHFKWMDA